MQDSLLTGLARLVFHAIGGPAKGEKDLFFTCTLIHWKEMDRKLAREEAPKGQGDLVKGKKGDILI